MTHRIFALDPASYRPHPTHSGDRIWAESNCYVDLWTELLHGAGFEPMAAMAFTIGVDLEGDQWTFFKFSLADLYTLYGVEVIELNLWRSLIDNVEEQLCLGRPSVVEADAWFLPDTPGTSYRTETCKDGYRVQMMDRETQRMGYFHNAGYYELSGDDFTGLPARGTSGRSGIPAALCRIGQARCRPACPVRICLPCRCACSANICGRRRIPTPLSVRRAFLSRFGVAFGRDPRNSPVRVCRAPTVWRFVELAGLYLRWLQSEGAGDLSASAEAFLQIADSAKALQFKTARFVNTRKPFDPSHTLDSMARAWDAGMNGLAR